MCGKVAKIGMWRYASPSCRNQFLRSYKNESNSKIISNHSRWVFNGGCVANLKVDTSSATESSFGSKLEAWQCYEIAEQYIKGYMIDPTSTLFDHLGCEKGYFNDIPILGFYKTTAHYGYVWRGFVNSKNSFGGYVGKERKHLLIRNGKVIFSADNGMGWGPMEPLARIR